MDLVGARRAAQIEAARAIAQRICNIGKERRHLSYQGFDILKLSK